MVKNWLLLHYVGIRVFLFDLTYPQQIYIDKVYGILPEKCYILYFVYVLNFSELYSSSLNLGLCRISKKTCSVVLATRRRLFHQSFASKVQILRVYAIFIT